MEASTNIEDARNYVTESFDHKKETLMISDELNNAPFSMLPYHLH
jgi:hypothetical protein